MPAPSLLQLSTAAAVRSYKLLNDIGNLPYSLARPFLLKIESPEKLRSLEVLSPHIMKDDAELWFDFIKRDIPRWEDYELPEKTECWYDVYCDLREQVERAVEEDAEKLKMALDGINSERAKHSAKLVTDRRSARLPRERPSAKHRYAFYDRKMGGFPEVKKKSSIFTPPKRNVALAVPTKQLNNRATQVRQAPRSLIEDHIRPSEPVITSRQRGPQSSVAPGRSREQNALSSRNQNTPANTPSFQAREARLRALTSGRPVPPLNSTESHSPPSSSSIISTTQTTPASKSTKESLGNNTAGDESQNTQTSPQVAVLRKRPAPSVFIQPKKKKVT